MLAVVRQTGYKPNLFIRDMFLKRRELIAVPGAASPDTVSAVVSPALAAAGYTLQTTHLSAAKQGKTPGRSRPGVRSGVSPEETGRPNGRLADGGSTMIVVGNSKGVWEGGANYSPPPA